MSHHYKLYYFNGRGRAELARLIFAAGGQAYEDIRWTQEEWPAHKGEFHFGQLPVLEVDGEKIGQSAAIAHFLGVQLGLAGKTAIDAFKCHALTETARDLAEPLVRLVYYEKDEERKAKQQEEYEKVTLKNYLDKFESYVAHAGASGFLVADTLTYADLALYNMFFVIGEMLKRDVLADHPHLKKHTHAVVSNARIAEYLVKRPNTPR